MNDPNCLPGFKRRFYAQEELADQLKSFLAELEAEIQGVKEALSEMEGAAPKKHPGRKPKPMAQEEKPKRGRKRSQRRQKAKPAAKGKTTPTHRGWPKGKPRKKVEIEVVEAPAEERMV